MILTLRTDKPESEIGLYDKNEQTAYLTWQAHRQLAETIHKKIENLLNEHSAKLKDIEGVVIFEGPGSYTGLRIGFSVAKSLSYGLSVPLVAVGGEQWIESGLKKIQSGEDQKDASPVYGGGANTTKQKK